MPQSKTRSEGFHLGAVTAIVALLAIGIFAGIDYANNTHPQSGQSITTINGSTTVIGSNTYTSSNTATVTNGYSCTGAAGTTQVSQSSALPIRSTLNPAGGDAALTTLVDNRFVAGTSNGQPALVQQSDAPPTVSGTAVTGSYGFSIQSGWVEQQSASNAYPIWTNVAPSATAGTVAGMTVTGYGASTGIIPPNTVTFGNSIVQGGVNVYSLSCYSPSNQIYDWNIATSPIQAPTTGTTSTTNLSALVVSQSGLVLTSAATKTPTGSQRFDVDALIGQAYKGYGYSTPFYGTASNAATNFGTLTSPSTGIQSYNAPVTTQTFLWVFANQTGLSVQLDSAAQSLVPGAGIVADSSNKLSSGTSAWLVGPLPGCAPASGSTTTTNKITCIDVPLDIYEIPAQGTSHISLQFVFADMQQGGYAVSYTSTPAVTATGWKLQGSFSGMPTGFTGLTTTGGGNSGNPSPLGEPATGIILGY